MSSTQFFSLLRAWGPTKLDEALVRPGRADVRSEFGYPSRANVRESFRAVRD